MVLTMPGFSLKIYNDSEAGSYLRLMNFVHHSTIDLRVTNKKKRAPVLSCPT